VLPILVRLRIEIPADPAKQSKSDREFLMTTQEVEQYLEQLHQEGRQEGERAGIARMLLEQLGAKLGPVPAKVQARVRNASLAELTAWTKRVLTATSFEAVLGPAPRRPLRPSAKKQTPR
jgi:hypothetical protein